MNFKKFLKCEVNSSVSYAFFSVWRAHKQNDLKCNPKTKKIGIITF